MIPRAQLFLAFSLLCFDSAAASLTSASETASATSLPASSGTVVATTDSTTSGSGTGSSAQSNTDSATVSLTITEASIESRTFLSVTTTGLASSDLTTTVSTAETLTTTESLTESPVRHDDRTTLAPTTATSARPDSSAFNIVPNEGSAASGLLKVRTNPGGSVYLNNPNPTYQTGEFVVNGRGRLVERGRFICAFFRTGQGYGDLNACRPDETDPQFGPITYQLTASEELECTVAGKFCFYQGGFLRCDDRGVYSSLYIETPGSFGYSVIIGPSGLTGVNRSPVELSAAPIETI
ncbi:hypothetical protein ACJZ2D_011407 [Fusarium nematophilum]